MVDELNLIVPHASVPRDLPPGLLPENVKLIRLRCGNGAGVWGRIAGRFFNLIFNVRAAWTLLGLQRSGRVDLVETTNYQYPCLLYSLCPGHAPIITRVSTTTRQIREANGKSLETGLGLIARLERMMIRRSSGVVTHTKRHAELTADELGFPISRFHIIPHGIFVPAECPPLPPPNPVNILFVGSLELRKGADVLIEGIKTLLERSQNVTFRIVGVDESDTYQKLLNASLSADARRRVTFLGAVTQAALEQEYRNCHLVVCPSRYESFGLVFAEAMSFGRVPVGTTAGGIPEVVENGQDGILVEPGSTTALVEGLERLLDNWDALAGLAAAARKSAESKFDRTLMAKRTIEHYSSFVPAQRNGSEPRAK